MTYVAPFVKVCTSFRNAELPRKVITHVNGTGGEGAKLSEKPDIGETELKILSLLYSGLDDASIARRLNLGHRTVQRHVQGLMTRLEAAGRVALGARAQEFGLLGRSNRGAA
ncbi:MULTISPECIES: response regulator transcription factor [unclassified Streptomyces]|uniref:response regulator transcription factor n=1 Tax=unclassified Streptomyces TaxID=2593676 RepID=UPI0009A0E7E4|nr:helix-turn-helix transcriptional regulator [Streptomyces sp. CB02400]